MTAATTITGEFEVTGWDQQPYDEPADGPALGRATVRKTFHGTFEGTSVAELLIGGTDDGRGYVAAERFTGAIDGRQGTIVFLHGGLDDNESPFTFGHVMPGSGTGELAGLAGTLVFAHDEAGARITLTLT